MGGTHREKPIEKKVRDKRSEKHKEKMRESRQENTIVDKRNEPSKNIRAKPSR